MVSGATNQRKEVFLNLVLLTKWITLRLSCEMSGVVNMTLLEKLHKGWATEDPDSKDGPPLLTDKFISDNNLLIIRGWFANYVFTNTRENRLIVKKYHEKSKWMYYLPLIFFPLMLMLYAAGVIVEVHDYLPALAPMNIRPRCILDRYLKMHGLWRKFTFVDYILVGI